MQCSTVAAQGRRENPGVPVPRLVEESRRLTELFECIPRTSGIFKLSKVTLTCVDAGDQLLVIGSDAGKVFIYERESKRFGTLAEEGKSNSVSCVKLCEPEQRVAFGCVSGILFIFQIQRRQVHDTKPLRMFRLDRDHSSPVTCIAWHEAGQILISGDEMGKIFISSVDMAKNECSIELLHRAGSSVVQLSAGVEKEWIIVSTFESSFLLSLNPRKTFIPIGQRHRKSGLFGACLRKSDEEVLAYVARPGFRIWKANLLGQVSATLGYRESLSSGEAPLIQMHAVQSSSSQQCADGQFRHLHLLAGKYIVTHCDNNLWVLDPDNNSILGCHGNLGRIIDIATTQTKIFLLREDAECPILVITFSPTVLPIGQPPLQNDPPSTVQLATHLPDHLLSEQTTQTIGKESDSVHGTFVHQEPVDGIGDQVNHQPMLECSLPEDTGVTLKQSNGNEDNQDLHENSLKREKFEWIGESKFEPIIYNPKKEKQRKLKRAEKTVNSIGALESNKPCENQPVSLEPESSFANSEESPQTLNERSVVSDKGSEFLDTDGEIDVTISDQSGQIEASDLQTVYIASGINRQNLEFDKELIDQTRKRSSVVSDGEKSKFDEDSTKSSADDDTIKESSVEDNTKRGTDARTSLRNGETSPMLTTGSPTTSRLNDTDEQNSPEDRSFDDEKSQVDKYSIKSSADEDNMSSLVDDVTIMGVKDNTKRISSGDSLTGHVEVLKSIYEKFKPEDDDVDDEDGKTLEKCEEHERSITLTASTLDAAVSSSLSHSATLVDSVCQGMDSWTLCPIPPTSKPIKCITLSNTHLFVVDQGYCTFMATRIGKAIGEWQKVDGNVRQISVSPNGLHILGVSSKNQLYVRLGVTTSCPSGEKWDKIADDIMYIAVEDNQMWGLRKDGSVVHSAVTSEKPIWNCLEDATGQSPVFVQVIAYGGVLWARDKAGSLYYRDGISLTHQQGDQWKMIEDGLKAMHICLGDHQTGWAVSTNGTGLFKQGITAENPAGESRWWEILLSDDRVDDYDTSVLNSLWSWVRPPDSSLKLVVANGEAGVCMLTGSSSIHLSNTALLGSYYEVVNLQGIPQSAANWLCVASGSLSSPTTGLVWALRRNGEIFCLPPNGRPFSVDPPGFANLTFLTASEGAVWALNSDRVLVREGINCRCLQGVSWKTADTGKMSMSRVRSLACGKSTVWAVDRVGRAWHRHVPDRSTSMRPVWKKMEDRLSEGCPLDRVAVAPNDSMVWAIDTKGNVYVRTGIVEPLHGNGWEYVNGVQAKELAVSETSVWVVSASEELVQRLGVSQSNCSGDCWKKVIGNFCQISVTPFDQLWGIKKDGQIFIRHINIYVGSQSAVGSGSHWLAH